LSETIVFIIVFNGGHCEVRALCCYHFFQSLYMN